MGLRTLSLVGLASRVAVQAIIRSGLPQVDADDAGRVVQGMLSGVGFFGAGALLRGGKDMQGHGLAAERLSLFVPNQREEAAGVAVRQGRKLIR